MLQLINTHENQKRYSIREEESNKFANQLNLTPKEIDMEYQGIEIARDIKKKHNHKD